MEAATFAEYALLAVVGVVTIVAVAVFSKRLGIAAPIILVVVGIGASYLPGVPSHFQVPPEVILVGILPPLLYSAAINVPLVDFRRNLNSISALSILLVLATALISGAILYTIFPDLNFAAAVALGAVISPTDAVAATALAKRLGLPPRLVTILEGESLVNDATALVLLKSALAATATAVSFWSVFGQFAFAVVVAVITGLVIGFATVWVRSKLHDPVLDTAISFVVPFLAFIPAEELGASGVLAVVVAGLYSGHAAARHFTSQARISERLNWRTVQFMLENGVFLAMGLQISGIITDIGANKDHDAFPVGSAILVGLLVTAVIVAVRIIFIGPLLLWIRRSTSGEGKHNLRVAATLEKVRALTNPSRRHERRADRVARVYNRRKTDVTQLKNEGVGWRGGLILSWSGMRGVVTLAAAQSLPTSTPYRAQLVLIAFTVAITTLIIQGGTLPTLIRLTGIRGTDRVADRRELATLLDELSEAGLAAIENPSLELPGDGIIDQQVLDRVRADSALAAESAWERAENGGGEDALERSPHQQYRALRREVLQAERAALLDARSRGQYASRILLRAQSMLDLEETRLAQIDNPSGS